MSEQTPTYRKVFPLGPMKGELMILPSDTENDDTVVSLLNTAMMPLAFEMGTGTDASTLSVSIDTTETPTVRTITIHDPSTGRTPVVIAFGW